MSIEHFKNPFPDTVVAKALMFRSRGLSYRAIAERMAETMKPAPTWECIRNWCAGRSTRAARLDLRRQA